MDCICGSSECDCKTSCRCQENICHCVKCYAIRLQKCALCSLPPLLESPKASNNSNFCNCFLSESNILPSEDDIARFDVDSANENLNDYLPRDSSTAVPIIQICSLHANHYPRINPDYENMSATNPNMIRISDCRVTGNNRGEEKFLPVISLDSSSFVTQELQLQDENFQSEGLAECVLGKYDHHSQSYESNCLQSRESKLPPNDTRPDRFFHEPESTIYYSSPFSDVPKFSNDESENCRNFTIRNSTCRPRDNQISAEIPKFTSLPFQPIAPLSYSNILTRQSRGRGSTDLEKALDYDRYRQEKFLRVTNWVKTVESNNLNTDSDDESSPPAACSPTAEDSWNSPSAYFKEFRGKRTNLEKVSSPARPNSSSNMHGRPSLQETNMTTNFNDQPVTFDGNKNLNWMAANIEESNVSNNPTELADCKTEVSSQDYTADESSYESS